MDLLQIAKDENALCLDFAMEVYRHRSSASRSISQMVEDGLLEERNAPNISKYETVWTVTEKSAKLLE